MKKRLRLILNKQTVRQMTVPELKHVEGGAAETLRTCWPDPPPRFGAQPNKATQVFSCGWPWPPP